VRDGALYLQLTRGVADRNPVFPDGVPPTLLFFARSRPPIVTPDRAAGIKLFTVPDERWRKCWIKAIGLTANVLAKNDAVAHDADEAAFVDEHDVVAECSSSNLFIVANGKLITHPVGPRVLPGITRHIVLNLARELGIDAVERPFTVTEAKAADELFITSTTRQIAWVGAWDDAAVGGDRCGPVTWRLHQAFEVYRSKSHPGVV
jgi:D-alanine transaminase